MKKSPAKKQALQRPKGTQDLYTPEISRWHHLEKTCQRIFTQYGYSEIRPPVFESTALFMRGVGETTDIVNKEMYTLASKTAEESDSNINTLTLRPEGTAGVVRAYIENGMSRWQKPVKLYYMGPMFRYERPQAGRQRQFHQIGIESFGIDSPAADAEVIFMAMQLFKHLGLRDLTLQINNIGTPACREQFKVTLKAKLANQLPQLCNDCKTRYETNPLRLLDCKMPSCQALLQTPEIQNFLAQDFTAEVEQKAFNQLLSLLDELEIAYYRNPTLVRGLDYYTRTVFEITSSSDALGAQNTICGGGRYNPLVETLGGPETPGIGWALGVERLLRLLPEIPLPPLDFYIATDCHARAFQLAERLYHQGFSAEVDLTEKPAGKQLEKASKRGAKQAILYFQDAVQARKIVCKTLSTGEQFSGSLDGFLEALQGTSVKSL
ncbi:MAG: histidine--tRNA ligase [Cyanobacteria bacterium P01_H01_bin.74]